jgi:serine/threonine protein kinase
LKPENILLDARGYVKLTDFGFAKHIPDNRTFTMCGTADYLAPEIIMGRGYGREVDWWALGVLIFEMLVGYPPFYDDNPYVIYENVINGAINWPPTPLPPQPDHLLRGLLQRDVTKRWGDTLLEDRNLRRHAWFQTIDWAHLHDVPAPWIPRIAHEFDASNFEILPEDDQMQQHGLDPSAPLPVVQPDTFANF